MKPKPTTDRPGALWRAYSCLFGRLENANSSCLSDLVCSVSCPEMLSVNTAKLTLAMVKSTLRPMTIGAVRLAVTVGLLMSTPAPVKSSTPSSDVMSYMIEKGIDLTQTNSAQVYPDPFNGFISEA